MKKEEFLEEEYEEENNKSIRKIFFFIILLLVLVFIYSKYIGTSNIVLNSYSINNDVPESYKGFKILQFSDIKYGENINNKEIKRLINKINKTKPDIVVFTGDLLNKNYKINNNEINFLIEEFNKIETTYGKYYIMGDYDIENPNSSFIFDNSGFMHIDDNFNIINNKNNDKLLICGIGLKSDSTKINEIITNNESNYKVILMHMPDTFDSVKDYGFNLALAGHSLGGQVRIPKVGALYNKIGAQKYKKNYYSYNNTNFYISYGIGTEEYDYRLFNRPSINLYRLN